MGDQQVHWRNRQAKRLKRLRPGPFRSIWAELSISEIKRQLLYRSQNLRSRGRGKPCKRRYQAEWRQQGRELEYAALIGDDQLSERICPDGTRGAITWDWR